MVPHTYQIEFFFDMLEPCQKSLDMDSSHLRLQQCKKIKSCYALSTYKSELFVATSIKTVML